MRSVMDFGGRLMQLGSWQQGRHIHMVTGASLGLGFFSLAIVSTTFGLGWGRTPGQEAWSNEAVTVVARVENQSHRGDRLDYDELTRSEITWKPPKARNPTPIAPLAVQAQPVTDQPTVGTSPAEAQTMEIQPPTMPLIRKDAHDVCQATGGEKVWFRYHGKQHWKCSY